MPVVNKKKTRIVSQSYASGGGGATGLQGATGIRGQTGLQGATGIRGQTGFQGTEGSEGDKGATGIQGITGLFSPAPGILRTSYDISINDSTKGLILKDTQATPHYWRLSVSNLGNLVTTDIGTSEP